MRVLLFVIGALIAGGGGHSYRIWILALIGLSQTGYAYWNPVTTTLRTMNAHLASQARYPQLYVTIHELAEKASQPLLSTRATPTRTPNAFTIGRDPQHAAVCCTEGVLQILGECELYAALGHELMYAHNRDTLISSVAAALGGLITSITQFLMLFDEGQRDNDRGGIGVLATLAMALLAPLAASVLQFLLSHTRELDTDEDGTRLSGDPLAFASALRKLEGGTDQVPLIPTPQAQNVSALMTANPFRGLRNLFSTRPPMNERIARPGKMTGY